MFKILKNKKDEKLFQALKAINLKNTKVDGIEVTEQEIQKAKKNDAAAPYKIGKSYYSKDSKKTYKVACQNHADAQTRLAGMYIIGRGVPENYKEAMKWATKAADANNSTGHFILGELYYNEKGVPKNYIYAMISFMMAAKSGDPDAQHRIGDMTLLGQGVSTDIPAAIEWYTKAAEQGKADSCFASGKIYQNADQVKDLQTFVNWYQKAK